MTQGNLTDKQAERIASFIFVALIALSALGIASVGALLTVIFL